MSIQELSDEQRILFLQEFTKSIILSLYKESASQEIIESEKIKIKYLQESRPFESFPGIMPFAENKKPQIDNKKQYTTSMFPTAIPQKNVLALPLTRTTPMRIPFRPMQPPQKAERARTGR